MLDLELISRGDSMIFGKKILSAKRKKEIHWQNFFIYEKHPLAKLTERKIKKNITNSLASKRGPFISSQILIKEVLNQFGATSDFHRQFNDNFPRLEARSILGMQLYMILLKSNDDWGYEKVNPHDHLYEHSLYWLLGDKTDEDEIARYISEVQENKKLEESEMKNLTKNQKLLILMEEEEIDPDLENFLK